MEERRGFLPCGTRRALSKTRQIRSESWTRAGPSHRSGSLQTRPSIKAKTLIITGGQLALYNPVQEAQEAAEYIPDARLAAIPSIQGHTAATATKAADVEFMNRTVREFLDTVTENGRKLQ